MWKPKMEPTTGRVGSESLGSGAMAHRRTMGGWKRVAEVAALVVATVMLAGSVWVSNQVTGLRAEISQLENRREFLEAGSASLLVAWNKATAPAVITERARRELGLTCPTEPDLVLVELPGASDKVSTWRRLLSNMGGTETAQAAPLPRDMSGTMVSLAPLALAVGGRAHD